MTLKNFPRYWKWDAIIDISLNKLLTKWLSCRWYETPWHFCDVIVIMLQTGKWHVIVIPLKAHQDPLFLQPPPPPHHHHHHHHHPTHTPKWHHSHFSQITPARSKPIWSWFSKILQDLYTLISGRTATNFIQPWVMDHICLMWRK